jgi:RNA-directed DNA polymerase
LCDAVLWFFRIRALAFSSTIRTTTGRIRIRTAGLTKLKVLRITNPAYGQKINFLKGLWYPDSYREKKTCKSKGSPKLKRVNNTYHLITDLENLQAADAIARRGKSKQTGVRIHDQNKDANIEALHDSLCRQTFKTSNYSTFTVYEPKERLVYALPYFPDRIAHHAIMNVLKPVFTACFTADTYSCIKGRGIHAAANNVKKALRDEAGTRYCLKLDIRKFYPSVNHIVLKQLLRKKFKDEKLLELLYEIIDSADGLPIGNLMSQYLANFYLCFFDHWLKEVKGVKHYFRYCDDLVILSSDKAALHQLRIDIADYLQDNLKLQLKSNYQVFPVTSRGIDFVGYVFYHTHTLIRKYIKQNFARKLSGNASKETIAAYWGWLKHCNSKNLIKKLTNEKFQRTGDYHRYSKFYGRQNIPGLGTGQTNKSTGI